MSPRPKMRLLINQVTFLGNDSLLFWKRKILKNIISLFSISKSYFKSNQNHKFCTSEYDIGINETSITVKLD